MASSSMGAGHGVDDCVVCLQPLAQPGCLLLNCHHVIHACCLLEAFKGAQSLSAPGGEGTCRPPLCGA